jgi:hypothetical protein
MGKFWAHESGIPAARAATTPEIALDAGKNMGESQPGSGHKFLSPARDSFAVRTFLLPDRECFQGWHFRVVPWDIRYLPS